MAVAEVSHLLIAPVASGSDIVVNSDDVDAVLVNVEVLTDEGRIDLFPDVVQSPVFPVDVKNADLVGLYVNVGLLVNQLGDQYVSDVGQIPVIGTCS